MSVTDYSEDSRGRERPRVARPNRRKRGPTRAWRCDRGNISIEFALVLPFMLLLVMGAFDFGRGFMERLRLNGAARAGAQYALANYNVDTAVLYTGVEQSARDDAEDPSLLVYPNIYCKCLDDTELTCGTPCAGGEVSMRYIEVDVTRPFEFMFEYPSTTGTMNLQGHSELRLR